jgi:hypothetical protein
MVPKKNGHESDQRAHAPIQDFVHGSHEPNKGGVLQSKSFLQREEDALGVKPRRWMN